MKIEDARKSWEIYLVDRRERKRIELEDERGKWKTVMNYFGPGKTVSVLKKLKAQLFDEQ